MIKLVNLTKNNAPSAESCDQPENYEVVGQYDTDYTGFVKIFRKDRDFVFESFCVNDIVDFDVVGWKGGGAGKGIYVFRHTASEEVRSKSGYLKELLSLFPDNEKAYKAIAAKMLGND